MTLVGGANLSKQLSDIVDKLIENTYNILNWKYLSATRYSADDEYPEGLPEEYDMYDQDELDKIVKLVEPLLRTAQQTRKFEAETSKDIVKLISSGKVSLDEAIKLMDVVRAKVEVQVAEDKRAMTKKLTKLMGG